jgi:hypothetical protein
MVAVAWKYKTEAERATARKAAARRHYERNKTAVIAKSKKRWREKHARMAHVARSAKLLRIYGLTRETYDALLVQQAGLCAICHGPPTRNDEFLVVDHCHLTGRVRGLLCHRCNSAIALLHDDPEILRRASEYVNG